MKITVLGSGTSSGVPTIGCSCAVCHSADPRDRRLRPSILLQTEGQNIVVDTTPDFREQILRARLDRLDAVVFTHPHADHILGLDDVRPFNFRHRTRIPIFASEPTFAVLRRVFDYVFEKREHKSMVPQLDVNIINESAFDVCGVRFEPIPVTHGDATIFGFRFGNVAYLTDHSAIPESSMQKLLGLDVLFLDALRHRPHPTHSTVAESIVTAERLRASRTYFTHICHDLPHEATQATLPPGVFLAYDGLEIEVNAAA